MDSNLALLLFYVRKIHVYLEIMVMCCVYLNIYICLKKTDYQTSVASA